MLPNKSPKYVMDQICLKVFPPSTKKLNFSQQKWKLAEFFAINCQKVIYVYSNWSPPPMLLLAGPPPPSLNLDQGLTDLVLPWEVEYVTRLQIFPMVNGLLESWMQEGSRALPLKCVIRQNRDRRDDKLPPVRKFCGISEARAFPIPPITSISSITKYRQFKC